MTDCTCRAVYMADAIYGPAVARNLGFFRSCPIPEHQKEIDTYRQDVGVVDWKVG